MNSWHEQDGALLKTFTFSNFADAIRFIDAVAVIAEEQQHHPTILNSYTSVTLTLSTHDEGDIVTQKDHALAAAIDQIVI